MRGRDAGAGLWVLLVAILGLIAGFVAWATWFEIEEVTRATGRVGRTARSTVGKSRTKDGGDRKAPRGTASL